MTENAQKKAKKLSERAELQQTVIIMLQNQVALSNALQTIIEQQGEILAILRDSNEKERSTDSEKILH